MMKKLETYAVGEHGQNLLGGALLLPEDHETSYYRDAIYDELIDMCKDIILRGYSIQAGGSCITYEGGYEITYYVQADGSQWFDKDGFPHDEIRIKKYEDKIKIEETEYGNDDYDDDLFG